MTTTKTTRDQIVALCAKAGIAPLRLAEIKDGCDADRIGRILCGQIDAMRPGTLVLGDPDAAYAALDLAIDCQSGRLSLD